METILQEAAKILNDSFHCTPILYGSFAVEKVLQKPLDAHDIDFLVEHGILEKTQEIISSFARAGFVFLHPNPLAFRKNRVEVELADRERWFATCGFSPEGWHLQQGTDYRYAILNSENLLKLYRHLVQDSQRSETKRHRDQIKIDFLTKETEKS